MINDREKEGHTIPFYKDSWFELEKRKIGEGGIDIYEQVETALREKWEREKKGK